MKLLAWIVAVGAIVVAGCSSAGDDQPVTHDMSIADLSARACLAIACESSCPEAGSYCVASDATASTGGCTSGQSTCGTHLSGDCGFTDRCLSPTVLGKLFVAVPEGGCGVQRVGCANGCVDGDGDGGRAAHCR